MACAAAVAVADAFKEEKILDNVNARYSLYFSELTANSKALACIKIRGAVPSIKGAESQLDCRTAYPRRARTGPDGRC